MHPDFSRLLYSLCFCFTSIKPSFFFMLPSWKKPGRSYPKKISVSILEKSGCISNRPVHRGAFCQFHSWWIFTATVGNPLESKLAKRTSVQWLRYLIVNVLKSLDQINFKFCPMCNTLGHRTAIKLSIVAHHDLQIPLS